MHVSIASPFARPSPFCRRVGIRTSTFEACSGFTHVTARGIAQPPMAAFVTRLQSSRSPDQTARQLPEQSTTLWVEPPSTGETRHRGALQNSRPYALRIDTNEINGLRGAEGNRGKFPGKLTTKALERPAPEI